MRLSRIRSRKVFLAHKTHPATDGQLNVVILNPYMIGRCLIDRYVEVVVGVIFVDRCEKFFFSEGIILVRHTEVPQDIFVSCFRHESVSGKLNVVVIRPYRDDLKLTGRAVEIHLKEVCAVFFLSESASSLPS